MVVKRILLVRHGETEYNASGRWQGQLDVPLSEIGRKQAAALGEYLKSHHIDAVYSSDLRRAYDTAQYAITHHDLEIRLEPRLREMHLGDFQGKMRHELRTEFGDLFDQWSMDDTVIPPNGESRRQLQQRAMQAWEEILAAAQGEVILLVSHGGTIRMMMQKIIPDAPMHSHRYPNTSLTILERDAAQIWRMTVQGATDHLP